MDTDDLQSWSRLLHFISGSFKNLRRAGKWWSTATLINHQVAEEADFIQSPTLRRKDAMAGSKDPLEDLASTVPSKLEEGKFKCAVCLACADDTLANYSPETLESLKRKHPAAHPNSCFDPSPNPVLFTVN